MEGPVKHYIMIETNVTNPAWINDYLRKVSPMVERYGGKYLTRTAKVEVLEGGDAPPQFALLVEFPTKADLMTFYNSEEYQPFKQARQAGAETRMLVVAAEGI